MVVSVHLCVVYLYVLMLIYLCREVVSSYLRMVRFGTRYVKWLCPM